MRKKTGAPMGKFKKKEFGSRDGGDRRDNKRFGDKKQFRGNSSRRDSGRGDFEKKLHHVTCAKCGRDCEVPFRPTGNKPVFCSDCYRKDGSARPSSEFSKSRNSDDNIDMKKEIADIHEKLDMIIDMLEDAAYDDEEDK